MRVRQPQGQPFSFCRRRTSTRKAGGWLSSSWGSHLVASSLAGVGAAAGASFDRTWGNAAALAAAFGFHGTVGMAVVVAGAAAVLAGLAAGEETHGRESDDGEDSLVYPFRNRKSETWAHDEPQGVNSTRISDRGD